MVSLIKVETLANNIRITVDEYDAPPVVVNDTDVQFLSSSYAFIGLVFETKAGVPTVGHLEWTGRFVPMPLNGTVTQSSSSKKVNLISGRQYEIQWITSGMETPYVILGQNTNIANNGYFFKTIPNAIYTPNNLLARALPSPEQFTTDGNVPLVPRPCYITVTVDNLGVTQITYDSMVVCFAEDTKISTQRGNIMASQVVRGDVVTDLNGMPIPILANVCFDRAVRLFSRLTNPSTGEALFVQENHSIFENGREILAKDSIYAESVILEPTYVHTFITHQRTFVNIQGFQVGTWSECAFDNFCTEDVRGQLCRFSTQ